MKPLSNDCVVLNNYLEKFQTKTINRKEIEKIFEQCNESVLILLVHFLPKDYSFIMSLINKRLYLSERLSVKFLRHLKSFCRTFDLRNCFSKQFLVTVFREVGKSGLQPKFHEHCKHFIETDKRLQFSFFVSVGINEDYSSLVKFALKEKNFNAVFVISWYREHELDFSKLKKKESLAILKTKRNMALLQIELNS